MKLISMTDFILQHKNLVNKSSVFDFAALVVNYADFLKQPLKLSMFFPCDEDEKPLQNPNDVDLYHKYKSNEEYLNAEIQYNKAKEKVLFEGFEIFKDMYYQTKREFMYFNDGSQLWRRLTYHNGNVEECFMPNNYNGFLCVDDIIDMNIILTESAIKQWNLS